MTHVQSAQANQHLDPKTVLLVDDNPTNLSVLFDALAQSGLRLLVAEDGEAALEQIQYAKPDIILLDVMMPCMDGFETCRRLKSNPDTKNIPIIFMTALNEIINKVEGLSIGGVDYITKPIQPDEVLARIKVHLELHDLQTQLKSQNLVLKQEIQDRERAEHALKLLLRTVSHDLKNPITGLLLVLRNILQQNPASNAPQPATPNSAPTTPAQTNRNTIGVSRAVLERMVDSAQHQLNLINSLLETHTLDPVENHEESVSQGTSVVLHRKSLEFHHLITSVIQEIEPFLEKYQGTVHHQVSSELSPVYGDSSQLWRVLENLITNAIKHNPPGVAITITARENNCHLICDVQDDGQGIPVAEQTSLFEPYRRAPAQSNTPGLGLGLYLCRQIVQAHGGTIQLLSHPDQGAMFRFTLPTIQHAQAQQNQA